MAAPGDKAEMRKLAQDVGARSVSQLEASLARIMSETGANGRWILGALVLLNGGGIATVASANGWLEGKAVEAAISFFVIGAALAVLAGLANALAGLFLSRQIGGASALWAQVASSGELSEEALKATANVRRASLLSAIALPAIGLVSLILFVAGAMTLGSGLAAPALEPQPVAAPPVSLGRPPLPSSPATAAPPAPAPEPKAAPASAPEPRPTPKRTPRRTAPANSAPPSEVAPSATPSSAPASTN